MTSRIKSPADRVHIAFIELSYAESVWFLDNMRFSCPRSHPRVHALLCTVMLPPSPKGITRPGAAIFTGTSEEPSVCSQAAF